MAKSKHPGGRPLSSKVDPKKREHRKIVTAQREKEKQTLRALVRGFWQLFNLYQKVCVHYGDEEKTDLGEDWGWILDVMSARVYESKTQHVYDISNELYLRLYWSGYELPSYPGQIFSTNTEKLPEDLRALVGEQIKVMERVLKEGCQDGLLFRFPLESVTVKRSMEKPVFTVEKVEVHA